MVALCMESQTKAYNSSNSFKHIPLHFVGGKATKSAVAKGSLPSSFFCTVFSDSCYPWLRFDWKRHPALETDHSVSKQTYGIHWLERQNSSNRLPSQIGSFIQTSGWWLIMNVYPPEHHDGNSVPFFRGGLCKLTWFLVNILHAKFLLSGLEILRAFLHLSGLIWKDAPKLPSLSTLMFPPAL